MLSDKMHDKVILLVEDNMNDAELAMLAFEKNNITNQIVHARDGVEALDYLEQNIENLPHLILLDLKLPKVDGLEVLRKIRTIDPMKFIPVVILTSSKERKDLEEAYKLGVNAYVRKPINFTEFTEAVKQVGIFWLLLNEQPV